MGKNLSEVGPVTHVADIVYHGDKMVLPDGMEIASAIALLNQRADYLNQDVNMSETFNVFPFDGAHAIDVVLTKKFGWSPSVPTPGEMTMFGKAPDTPPALITIDVGHNETKQVPWGSFSLPGVAGLIGCDVSRDSNGRFMFQLTAEVKRKDEATIKSIFAMVREELKTNSIYRGKALKLRFRDDNGKALSMPEPKFLDVSRISENIAIYPADVQNQIRINLFAPIQRVQDCIANGIPVKRGVLLGGTYGVGKTLAAVVASKLSVDAGITYVYVPRANELADAIEFAKQYQSPACTVFCEDIDRALSGERSVKMDDILNIIDGIDTKACNLIVVLTTNSLDSINPAMLRPGRLDAVIEILPPDGAAVEKLIRLYGRESIPADTDLTAVGTVLAGNIPAVIAEVVKRAKLAQLSIQEPGTKVVSLTSEALIASAHSMASQLELLKKRTEEEGRVPVPALETAMVNTLHKALNGTFLFGVTNMNMLKEGQLWRTRSGNNAVVKAIFADGKAKVYYLDGPDVPSLFVDARYGKVAPSEICAADLTHLRNQFWTDGMPFKLGDTWLCRGGIKGVIAEIDNGDVEFPVCVQYENGHVAWLSFYGRDSLDNAEESHRDLIEKVLTLQPNTTGTEPGYQTTNATQVQVQYQWYSAVCTSDASTWTSTEIPSPTRINELLKEIQGTLERNHVPAVTKPAPPEPKKVEPDEDPWSRF